MNYFEFNDFIVQPFRCAGINHSCIL